MTLDELKASAEIWITAKVAAPFLRCDPNALRDKIRNNPDDVGYKVQTNKSRVLIHRKDFLRFLEEDA